MNKETKTGLTLLLVAALLYINPLSALSTGTLVFSSGFETGDLSEWTVYQGTPTVTSSVAYAGTYSLIASDDETSVTTSWAEENVVYISWNVRASALPSTGNYETFIFSKKSGGYSQVVAGWENVAGVMNVKLVSESGSQVTPYNFQAGNWYSFKLKIDATSDEAELFVNGVSKLVGSYMANPCIGIGIGSIQRYGGSGWNTYIDDVLVTTSETLEPSTHQLTVNSSPAGVSWSAGTYSGTTPSTVTVNEGSYSLSVPNSVSVGGENYVFGSWDNGLTSPTRTITVISDMTCTATYNVEGSTSPPPPPPTSGNGNLEVHAYSGETEVNAQYTVDGVSYETSTTGNTVQLVAGTYSVSCVYNGETLTETVVLTDGATERVDFVFNPPSQNPPDETPSLSSLPILALVTGVVAVMFLYTGKKKSVGR